VSAAHGLRDGEQLLGWLYVGGRDDDEGKPRKLLDPERFVSTPSS